MSEKRIGAINLPVKRLHLELTNMCNFSCEFCPDHKMKRKKGIMPLEMAKSIIKDVSESEVAELVLFHVMGEPILYPKLLEISEYASSLKVDVCITTNSSLMDLELFRRLTNIGIKKIIISLQTPDENTFSMRGAKGISFKDYAARISSIAREVLNGKRKPCLEINFLSSPLRRLIIPIAKEFSIADNSKELRVQLKTWAEIILKGSILEERLPDIFKKINRTHSFIENLIPITENLSFRTRIVGDWAVHFDRKNVNAFLGYCPGLQENFGILWNGKYTFCCTDYDGRTSDLNYTSTSITDFLNSETVQEVVKGFQRARVLHPYCKQCLGDRNLLNAVVKQIGSIIYFKLLKN